MGRRGYTVVMESSNNRISGSVSAGPPPAPISSDIAPSNSSQYEERKGVDDQIVDRIQRIKKKHREKLKQRTNASFSKSFCQDRSFRNVRWMRTSSLHTNNRNLALELANTKHELEQMRNYIHDLNMKNYELEMSLRHQREAELKYLTTYTDEMITAMVPDFQRDLEITVGGIADRVRNDVMKLIKKTSTYHSTLFREVIKQGIENLPLDELISLFREDTTNETPTTTTTTTTPSTTTTTINTTPSKSTNITSTRSGSDETDVTDGDHDNQQYPSDLMLIPSRKPIRYSSSNRAIPRRNLPFTLGRRLTATNSPSMNTDCNQGTVSDKNSPFVSPDRVHPSVPNKENTLDEDKIGSRVGNGSGSQRRSRVNKQRPTDNPYLDSNEHQTDKKQIKSFSSSKPVVKKIWSGKVHDGGRKRRPNPPLKLQRPRERTEADKKLELSHEDAFGFTEDLTVFNITDNVTIQPSQYESSFVEPVNTQHVLDRRGTFVIHNGGNPQRPQKTTQSIQNFSHTDDDVNDTTVAATANATFSMEPVQVSNDVITNERTDDMMMQTAGNDSGFLTAGLYHDERSEVTHDMNETFDATQTHSDRGVTTENKTPEEPVSTSYVTVDRGSYHMTKDGDHVTGGGDQATNQTMPTVREGKTTRKCVKNKKHNKHKTIKKPPDQQQSGDTGNRVQQQQQSLETEADGGVQYQQEGGQVDSPSTEIKKGHKGHQKNNSISNQDKSNRKNKQTHRNKESKKQAVIRESLSDDEMNERVSTSGCPERRAVIRESPSEDVVAIRPVLDRPARRAAANICSYKEQSLRKKMRRS